MQEFIEQSKKDLLDGNHKEGDYCVIIYTYYKFNGLVKDKKVNAIYKNLEDFELYAEKRIEKIDPMFGIYLEIFLYDKN